MLLMNSYLLPVVSVLHLDLLHVQVVDEVDNLKVPKIMLIEVNKTTLLVLKRISSKQNMISASLLHTDMDPRIRIFTILTRRLLLFTFAPKDSTTCASTLILVMSVVCTWVGWTPAC